MEGTIKEKDNSKFKLMLDGCKFYELVIICALSICLVVELILVACLPGKFAITILFLATLVGLILYGLAIAGKLD